MKIKAIVFYFISATMAAGCSRSPDQVKEYKSPYDSSVFYTEETYFGHGAVDNDYTRVFVNATVDGKEEKQQVLGGEYLEITKITWEDQNNATICIPKNTIVTAYSSLNVLINDRKDFTIHTHLKEEC